jgi:hypothetical protein
MKDERKQILDMLAEGKISAEDAERLLDRLESDEAVNPDLLTSTSPGVKTKLKYLRVVVDSADGDKVNVRVPLALIKTGIKLTAVLPDNATEQLHEKGVDLSRLSELDAEELDEALRELQVDVDSGDGDLVRVFCE